MLVALGCGGDTSREAPPLQRLTSIPWGELVASPGAVSPSVVWEESFRTWEEGDGAWRRISHPADPLHFEEGVLRAEVAVSRDEDGPHLTLAGRRGLVVHVVPVEPDRVYRFSGRLRADGLVAAAEPFHGATFWIAQAPVHGTLAEIAGEDAGASLLKRHVLRTALGETGWTERELVFRTRAGTRALLIGCALGTTEEVTAGRVDFADLRLEACGPEALWDSLLVGERARLRGVTPDEVARGSWKARRFLRTELQWQSRPSILLFPGERLRLKVTVPGKTTEGVGARLETGLGPWLPGWPDETSGELAFTIRAGRDELLSETIAVPGEEERARTTRWQDRTVDLSSHAGEAVVFELACTGPFPGVFGAPRIVAGSPPAADAPPRPQNVFLISIDTLRADHVSAYGYHRKTTPNLDRFAAENLLFTDVTAQAPYTLPSTITMLSGQYPAVHGVVLSHQALSPTRSPLLPEILRDAGYQTRAFTAGGFVGPDFGLDAGFDHFSYFEPFDDPQWKPFGTDGIRRFLRETQRPFFLFLHTFTVHNYEPPDEWLPCADLGCTTTRTDYSAFKQVYGDDEVATPAEIEHLSHLYDGCLSYVDHELGKIFDEMESLGLMDDTIVVVTSDHGEEMFERGVVQHGKTLYEELTRIPLIVRVPGRGPEVLGHPAMTVDVTPTILARLGLAQDDRMQGQDLLDPRLDPRPVVSEVTDRFAHKYALRNPDGWKIIHGPLDADVVFPNDVEWELYDTGSDPGERKNLATDQPERFDRLRRILEARREMLRTWVESYDAVPDALLDEATRRELTRLGYAGFETE